MTKTIKIFCWNINGLRAFYKKGAWESLIKDKKPDIICLQEIKALKEQLPEELQNPAGYETLINSAKVKKGYSGVAIYSHKVPETVEYGMGVDTYAGEGRVLTTHFKDFTLCNIYFPNGGMSEDRLNFKLGFYDAFLEYVGNLRKVQPNILFCGDVNTAHNEIDLARPKENSKRTGFLPIEREWLDAVVDAGFIDVYRSFNPNKKDMYTWWDVKTRARDRNVGWRIDYFFATPSMMKKIQAVDIHTDILGSDHCPLSVEVKL